MFAVFAMITRKDPMKLTPFSEAFGPSVRRLGPLLPYLAILAGTLVFYAYALDTYLDEFSAPIVLPVLVAVVVTFERKFSRNFASRNEELG